MTDRYENIRLIAACDPDTIRALLAERDALRQALETMVEMVEMNGFGRAYAMDVARAALTAQPAAAMTVQSDENGGHRLLEPDHETALALTDAPRSLRNYVAALRSAIAAMQARKQGGE